MAKNKKPIYKRVWFIAIVLLVIIGVVKSMGNDDSATVNSDSTGKEVTQNQSTKEKEEDNVPTEHKNALKKAQSYQKTMSMSPSAIYDQLISQHGEKFTAEEAQYAIDNLK